MEIIKKYYKYIIFIIIIILFISSSFLFLENTKIKEEKSKPEVITKKEEKEEDKKEIKKYIYVDLKGAVKNPNVYKIEEGTRIIDLINLAGGINQDADTSILNLSKILKDEMCIIIYTKNEINEYRKSLMKVKEINQKLEEKIVSIDDFNDAEITKSEKKTTKKQETSKMDSKISINNANKDELQTISGIGESRAEAIIKYREENGLFKSIDDIKNVSGIGESLFEKIKEYIEL